MRREGPYREEGDIKKPIEQLRKEIARKNMIGLQLPEYIKKGDILEQFTVLEKFGFRRKENVDKYKNIALYSYDLGILNFIEAAKNPPENCSILHWQNEDKSIDVGICVDHNKNEVTVSSIFQK